MIVDSLRNCSLYTKNDERLKAAFDFLKRHTLERFADGRYCISEDCVLARVSSYDTVEYKEGKYESHRKNIDIHYILEGSEKVYWYNSSDEADNYDESTDCSFYPADGADGIGIPLRAGDFIILYPKDIHMAKCINENKEYVSKVVVKIAIE